MRRRHPHLFDLGDAEPWERIKRRERQGKTLAGIVPTLPPLLKAYRLQERAASVGFDWPDAGGPMAKVSEELAEVERELESRPGPRPDPSARRDEIGDLLFAVVNLARKAGVQPGPALDRANRKFRDRFEAVERAGAERGIDLDAAGLEVLDGLWDEVKSRVIRAQRGTEQRPMLARDPSLRSDDRSTEPVNLPRETRSPPGCAGCRRSRRPSARRPSPKPECTNVPYFRRSRYQR